jgi:hypothetical protein
MSSTVYRLGDRAGNGSKVKIVPGLDLPASATRPGEPAVDGLGA